LVFIIDMITNRKALDRRVIQDVVVMGGGVTMSGWKRLPRATIRFFISISLMGSLMACGVPGVSSFGSAPGEDVSAPAPMSDETLESTEQRDAFSLRDFLAPAGGLESVNVFRQGRVFTMDAPEDIALWDGLLSETSILDAAVQTYVPGTVPPPGSLFEIEVKSAGRTLGLSVVSWTEPQIRCHDDAGRLVVIRGGNGRGFEALCRAADALA
jgi:hypothetical protein